MANQNLSQFTEKTFVADADWTFVWDTVGAISKKVSRNNWLNSGTLTADAPVTISQTWDQAATLFTALKVNATSTNSLTTSRLLDLQAGGVTKFNVDRTGNINVDPTNSSAFLTFKVGAGTAFQYYGGSGYGSQPLNVMAAAGLSVSQGVLALGANTVILRDGADNTLALRNSTAAQTFNIYGTWTTAVTNFERLAIKYNASDLAYQIAAEKGSTNGDYRPLDFVMGGSRRMTIGTTGNVGIGTTAPSSKLQVTGGDVEIETVTSGIIMKAAGTSTRYRITLNAGGTALVFTAV